MKGVNIFKEWIQGHHKAPDVIRFKKEDGSFTETDKEVTQVLVKYLYDVFNSDDKID